MSAWDDLKGFFNEIYDDVTYVKERSSRKYAEYYRAAESAGKKLGLDFEEGGLNDKSDAFRHIFASAQASKDFGTQVSAAAGYYHEFENMAEALKNGAFVERLPENMMDIHNNKLGREIAKEAEDGKWTSARLGHEVKKAIQEGRAITRPSILDYYKK